MDENQLNFGELFEEIKFEIFKYLDLNDRIRCRYVSREWLSILSGLLNLQETIVIGQPQFDSTARMKLSLCNINARHMAAPFNTIDTNELLGNNTKDGVDAALSHLLKTAKNLKSIFIYAPVKINMSDLPDSIEHIHFGHNIENVIVFDKTNFPRLTCLSTIDAHLDERYSAGIINLLKAQKLQFENVSVCEVPRTLCEQIIEMQNLKQLYVFDFKSDFDALYKEKNLEIMDAHPKLQYFNMFSYFGPESVCPTENIKWLVEFGSSIKPLDRKFLIDVFDVVPFNNTLEFGTDYVHGLHLTFMENFETRRYQIQLNALRYLRLTCYAWPISIETLQLSLGHLFGIAPNLQNLHLRFFTNGIFESDERMATILCAVCAFAEKNARRPVLFELSAFGQKPHLHSRLPKNLRVAFYSIQNT